MAAAILSGRVALITGASSGIGEGAAVALAAAGAQVAVSARRADRLEHLVKQIEDGDGKAIALPGDIVDEVGGRPLRHQGMHHGAGRHDDRSLRRHHRSKISRRDSPTRQQGRRDQEAALSTRSVCKHEAHGRRNLDSGSQGSQCTRNRIDTESEQIPRALIGRDQEFS